MDLFVVWLFLVYEVVNDFWCSVGIGNVVDVYCC